MENLEKKYEIMKENALTLAARIDKVVKDLIQTKQVNKKYTDSYNNTYLNIDVDHIDYLIDILEGRDFNASTIRESKKK